MWVTADGDHEDPVQVEVAGTPDDSRVRVLYGRLSIRLSVAEAVDLVDAVVGAIAEIEQRTHREIRRDEDRVRAEVAAREGLS